MIRRWAHGGHFVWVARRGVRACTWNKGNADGSEDDGGEDDGKGLNKTGG